MTDQEREDTPEVARARTLLSATLDIVLQDMTVLEVEDAVRWRLHQEILKDDDGDEILVFDGPEGD